MRRLIKSFVMSAAVATLASMATFDEAGIPHPPEPQ